MKIYNMQWAERTELYMVCSPKYNVKEKNYENNIYYIIQFILI